MIFLKESSIIYLILAVLGLHCRTGFSLLAMCSSLTEVASVVQHGLQALTAAVLVAPGLSRCGSQAQ